MDGDSNLRQDANTKLTRMGNGELKLHPQELEGEIDEDVTWVT